MAREMARYRQQSAAGRPEHRAVGGGGGIVSKPCNVISGGKDRDPGEGTKRAKLRAENMPLTSMFFKRERGDTKGREAVKKRESSKEG